MICKQSETCIAILAQVVKLRRKISRSVVSVLWAPWQPVSQPIK